MQRIKFFPKKYRRKISIYNPDESSMFKELSFKQAEQLDKAIIAISVALFSFSSVAFEKIPSDSYFKFYCITISLSKLFAVTLLSFLLTVFITVVSFYAAERTACDRYMKIDNNIVDSPNTIWDTINNKLNVSRMVMFTISITLLAFFVMTYFFGR